MDASAKGVSKRKIIIDDFEEIQYVNVFAKQGADFIIKRIDGVIEDAGEYVVNFNYQVTLSYLSQPNMVRKEIEKIESFSSMLLKNKKSELAGFICSLCVDLVLTEDVQRKILDLFKYKYKVVEQHYLQLVDELEVVRTEMPAPNLVLDVLLHMVSNNSYDIKMLLKQIAYAEKNNDDFVNSELQFSDDKSLNAVNITGQECKDFFASFHMQVLTVMACLAFIAGLGFVINYDKMTLLVSNIYNFYIKAGL